MTIPTDDIPPCHICGADRNERVWTDTNAGQGTFGFNQYSPLKVRSDAHRVAGSLVKALVCKRCGNVQLFIDPQDFS
jgi:hypothetical protein